MHGTLDASTIFNGLYVVLYITFSFISQTTYISTMFVGKFCIFSTARETGWTVQRPSYTNQLNSNLYIKQNDE